MTDAEAMEWWLAISQDARTATLRKHSQSKFGPRWWCDIEVDDWTSFGRGETPFDAIRQCHARWKVEAA